MAFKGGFLVKPTTTNTQNLASLLLQGTQAIEEKKEKLDAIATDLAGKTNSAINIPVSGPEGFPLLMTDAASKIRAAQTEAYDKWSKREIGLDEYKMISSKLRAEAEMMSKVGELSSKQTEEINKGVEDGVLSPITKVLQYGVFRATTGADDKESVLTTSIDPSYNLRVASSHFEIQNGQKVPVTYDSTLAERFSHSFGKITEHKAVNVEEDIKKFKDIIKDRKMAEMVTEPQKDPLTNEIIGYSDVFRIDQAKDQMVQIAKEEFIRAYDPASLVDIAYQKLGMKPTIDPSFRESTQAAVNSRFGSRYKDENGDVIEVSPDDMIIRLSDNGLKAVLTPKQEKLTRAYLRNMYDSSLGITETIKQRKETTGKLTISEQAKAAPLTSAVYDRQSLVERTQDQQDRYNEFAPKEKQATSETGDYVIYDADLQALLSNSKSEVSSYSIDSRLHEPLAELMNEKSFFNSRLDTINAYAVIKDSSGEFNLVFIGGANIGKSKTTTQGQIARETETSDYTNEAVSGIASPQQAKRFYQFMYNNNDNFRRLAENRSFVLDEEDYMTALAVLSEASLLMPK